MRRASLGLLILLSLLLLPAPHARAAAARSWSLASAEEFSPGRLQGTALDGEGRIALAPALANLWGPAEGIVWDLEPDGAGGAFVAVSSPTRVIHLRPGAEPEFWHATGDETLVAAILPDGSGGLYIGLSPDGRLLHATGPGEVEPLADSEALFIWALAAGSDGSVWIGTGLPGRLLRVDPEGRVEAVFESGDDPVRTIAALDDGGVVFGTGGRGRVIRVKPGGRPFVLFDSEETEIVALEIDVDGTIYALAARGAKQVAAARSASSVHVVERVTATAPQSDDPQAQPEPEPEEQPGQSARSQPAARFKTLGGGALYRIAENGDFRRLWDSTTEVPFALARRADGSSLVATGDAGRVYAVDDDGRSSVLVQLASDQASALVRAPDDSLLVGGTTDARVERIEAGPGATGMYLSPVHDAGGVANWGRLHWEAELPSGSKVRAEVRAGNTAAPDPTWTGWRRLHGTGALGVETGLPSTRWFQTRLVLEPSAKGISPAVRRVELYYQPHNRRPTIDELTVQPAGVVWSRSLSQPARPNGPSMAADPVSRKTVAGLRPLTTARPVRKSYQLGARTISWSASDPDQDGLSCRLDIRREGKSAWIPLAVDLDGDFFGWDARDLPDGLYRARLVVSDARDNPQGADLEDQRTSAAFRVDNTRPAVGDPRIERGKMGFEVEFVATDHGGNVVAAEVAVDSGDWKPLDPLDGVADEAEERYQLVIALRPRESTEGPRTLKVRVTDSAGNMAGDAWVLDGED